LAENGLFRHLETLPVLSGYYMKLHVILLLAYMAQPCEYVNFPLSWLR